MLLQSSKTRRWSGWFCWIYCLHSFLITCWVSSLLAAPAKPPNILLIISDDQAWNDYGFMGHPSIRTPRLDRLAAESACFTRGYVPSSLCCPSLASILTGLPPQRHRVVCNDPPRPPSIPASSFYRSPEFLAGRDRLAGFIEAVPTLPKSLASRGYQSFQSGKWWQGNYSHGGFTQGMTRGERHGDEGLIIGRTTLEPIDSFVSQAEHDGKPWMVWYAPMMPHDPHTPPERLLAKYRTIAPSLHVARYWAMVEWFDETCGHLLDMLDRKGLAENTVVAYVADNGWITDPITGRFASRSKQSPYDGGLRTPILLRWPSRIKPFRDATHPVSSLDFMPTLLEAAGLPKPAGLTGISLLQARAFRQRTAIHGACFTHNGVDLDHPESGLRWRWIIDGPWKLILPASWNEPNQVPELYHLMKDPGELHNLATLHPGRVHSLRRKADREWNPQPPLIRN